MTPSAGYSGTPLPRKLGIKPGNRVLLLSAPAGFEADTWASSPTGCGWGGGRAAAPT